MVLIKLYFIFSIKIRIGDTNHNLEVNPRHALVLDIIRSQIHPKFNHITSYFDVAVLTTDKITFSKFISPVCLPNSASDDIHKYDNNYVELTGWHQNNLHGEVSDKLKRVSLKVYPLR